MASFNISYHTTEYESEYNRRKYPHGYWHAVTEDGGYDADGPTVELAMAELLDVVYEALKSSNG